VITALYAEGAFWQQDGGTENLAGGVIASLQD
jgi:hypothetical protein